MAKTIQKFELDDPNNIVIEMPLGAEILNVGLSKGQHQVPAIWALVDPDRETEKRYFEVFSTNQMIPDDGDRFFRGTMFYPVQHPTENEYVFHIFERLDK